MKLADFTISVTPTLNPAELTAAIRKAEQSAPKLTLKTNVDSASLDTQATKITAALSKAATIKLKFDTPSLTAEIARIRTAVNGGLDLKVRLSGTANAVNDLNTLKTLIASVGKNVGVQINVNTAAITAANNQTLSNITQLTALIAQLKNLGGGSAGGSGSVKLPAGVQNTLLEIERLNNLFARGQINSQNYTLALTTMQGRLQAAAQAAGSGTQEFARIDAQITKVSQSLRNLGNGESIAKLRTDMAALRATFDSTAGGFSRNSTQFKNAARDYQAGAALIETRLNALANSGRLTVQQMGQVNTMLARLAREQNTLAGGTNFLGLSGNIANGIGASLNGFMPIISALSPSLGAAAMNAGSLAGGFSQVAASVGPMGVAIGGAALALVGIAKVMNDAVNAAAQFQQGMQGITSVARLTGSEVQGMRGNFQKLSTELPVSTEQLTGIARNAALLGVEGSASIEQFTKAVAMLGVATRENNKGFVDLSKMAEDLAIFLNETGSTAQTFAKDMDSVVATLASVDEVTPGTIQGVLQLTKYMASGAVTLNLSREAILGIAGALSGLGAKAEAGGSAVVRVLLAMNRSAGGSKEALDGLGESLGITKDELANLFEGQPTAKLDAFARVMGVTASQAKELIRNSPDKAFLALADGLRKAHDSGQDFSAILDELGLKNIRDIRLIDQLTVGNTSLRKSLDAVANAEENKARLQERVNAATDNLIDATTEAKNATLSLLQNTGEPMLKFLTGLSQGWRDAANYANDYLNALKGFPNSAFTDSFLKQKGVSASSLNEDQKKQLNDLVGQYQAKSQQIGVLELHAVNGNPAVAALAKLGLASALKEQQALEKAINNLIDELKKRPGGFIPPNTGNPSNVSTAARVVKGEDLIQLLGVAGAKIWNDFGVMEHFTDKRGKRQNLLHNGIDYGAPAGTPILAPFTGDLTYRKTADSGNIFELVDAAGNKIVGAHLQEFNAEVQAAFEKGGKKAIRVVQGQQIGKVGDTGNLAEGAHLHLMAYLANTRKPVDARTVAFQGFTGDDPALRLPGAATASAINAAKTADQYLKEAKRLVDAVKKYDVGGAAENYTKFQAASRILEAFTKDNKDAADAVAWVQKAQKDTEKYGQVYAKLSQQLSVSESLFSHPGASSAAYLKSLDDVAARADKAAAAELKRNGQTQKYVALYALAGEAAKKAAGEREKELADLTRIQQDALTKAQQAAELTKSTQAALDASQTELAQTRLDSLKANLAAQLTAQQDNAAARLNLQSNLGKKVLELDDALALQLRDKAKKNADADAAVKIAALTKQYGKGKVPQVELDKVTTAQQNIKDNADLTYNSRVAGNAEQQKQAVLKAQQDLYRKQNEADKKQADIQKQVADQLANLTQKQQEARVKAEEDALKKLQNAQDAEVNAAGDNAAKKLEIITRTSKAIENQAIKTAETQRQVAYKTAQAQRDAAVRAIPEGATAEQRRRITQAADAQLLKDRQAADRAYSLSVSDAVQATLNAEREASKARLDEQKKFADELSKNQIQEAQDTADRLKLLDDAQTEAAGDNLIKRAALVKKFSQDNFNRQAAILQAQKKAEKDAADDDGASREVVQARLAAIDAKYALAYAKLQQDRAAAVTKSNKDITDSIQSLSDKYKSAQQNFEKKLFSGDFTDQDVTDYLRDLNQYLADAQKNGIDGAAGITALRDRARELLALAPDLQAAIQTAKDAAAVGDKRYDVSDPFIKSALQEQGIRSRAGNDFTGAGFTKALRSFGAGSIDDLEAINPEAAKAMRVVFKDVLDKMVDDLDFAARQTKKIIDQVVQDIENDGLASDTVVQNLSDAQDAANKKLIDGLSSLGGPFAAKNLTDFLKGGDFFGDQFYSGLGEAGKTAFLSALDKLSDVDFSFLGKDVIQGLIDGVGDNPDFQPLVVKLKASLGVAATRVGQEGFAGEFGKIAGQDNDLQAQFDGGTLSAGEYADKLQNELLPQLERLASLTTDTDLSGYITNAIQGVTQHISDLSELVDKGQSVESVMARIAGDMQQEADASDTVLENAVAAQDGANKRLVDGLSKLGGQFAAKNLTDFLSGGDFFGDQFYTQLGESGKAAFIAALDKLGEEDFSFLGKDVLQGLIDGIGDNPDFQTLSDKLKGALGAAAKRSGQEGLFTDLGSIIGQGNDLKAQFDGGTKSAQEYRDALRDDILPQLQRIKDLATDPALQSMIDNAIQAVTTEGGDLAGVIQQLQESDNLEAQDTALGNLISRVGGLNEVYNGFLEGTDGAVKFTDSLKRLRPELEVLAEKAGADSPAAKLLALLDSDLSTGAGMAAEQLASLARAGQDADLGTLAEQIQGFFDAFQSGSIDLPTLAVDLAGFTDQLQNLIDLDPGSDTAKAAQNILDLINGVISTANIGDDTVLDELETKLSDLAQQADVTRKQFEKGIIGKADYQQQMQGYADELEKVARNLEALGTPEALQAAESVRALQKAAQDAAGPLGRLESDLHKVEQAFRDVGEVFNKVNATLLNFGGVAGNDIDLGKIADDIATGFQGAGQAVTGFAKVTSGDMTGIKDIIVGVINVVGGFGDAILALNPKFAQWKKNLLEIAEIEKNKVGAKNVGPFKNPYFDALNQDAENREKLANASFFQRIGFFFFGAPKILSDGAAKLKAMAAEVFNDMGSTIGQTLTDSLINAFESNDFTDVGAAFDKAINKLVATMAVQTVIAGSKLGPLIQKYSEDYANAMKDGVIDGAEQGILNADVGNLKGEAGRVTTLAQGVLKGLPGFGSESPTGSLASLDARISKLQAALNLATTQTERLSLQQQIEALNQQKNLLTPGSGAGLTSGGININASESLTSALSSGVSLNLDALGSFAQAAATLATQSMPMFDLSVRRFGEFVNQDVASRVAFNAKTEALFAQYLGKPRQVAPV